MSELRREVKMFDLVRALRRANIHAADCWHYDSDMADACDCWVDPEVPLIVVVNG